MAADVFTLLGAAATITVFFILRVLRQSRNLILLRPDLAFLYAVLGATAVVAGVFAYRAYREARRRGTDTTKYKTRQLLWALVFGAASAAILFVPKLYQAGLQAWEPTSKALAVRLDPVGTARVQYIYDAVARRDGLRYFVMDVPVKPSACKADDGRIQLLDIAGKQWVAIELASIPTNGEKRRISIYCEYPRLFRAQQESVSLRVDNLYDELSLDVTFPQERPMQTARLSLFYHQAYEAIPGPFLSSDRLHFRFHKRDRPFAWIPYHGTYQLVWEW